MKTTIYPQIRKSVIFVSLLILILAVGLYAFSKVNNTYTTPNATNQSTSIQADSRLTGKISSLPVAEWGIKLSFKDADKVTYKLIDTSNNSLELYVKDTYLPSGGCGRLGVMIQRSTTKKADVRTTQIGEYYYNQAGAPSYCDSNKSQNKQTSNFKRAIVAESFGNALIISSL